MRDSSESSTYVANVPERRFRRRAECLGFGTNLHPRALGVARLDRSGDDVANLVVVLVLIEQVGEFGVLLGVLPAHANLFAHDGAANDGGRRPRVGARANPHVDVDGARAQRLGGDRVGGHRSLGITKKSFSCFVVKREVGEYLFAPSPVRVRVKSRRVRAVAIHSVPVQPAPSEKEGVRGGRAHT